MAQLKSTTVNGDLTVLGNLILKDGINVLDKLNEFGERFNTLQSNGVFAFKASWLKPSSGSSNYGRTFIIGLPPSDSYALTIDSNNNTFTGTALNGSTDYTWKKI